MDLILIPWGLKSTASEQDRMCETETLVTYKILCLFILLHMRLCCTLSSVCLQNLKIYVLLQNVQFLVTCILAEHNL